jgi:hypothetical protein
MNTALVRFDYGYHDISMENKLRAILEKSKSFKVFADVISNNIRNVSTANWAESRIVPSTSFIDIKFTPIKEKGFFFHGAGGIYTRIALRLVSSHFEKTQKEIENVACFSGPGREYHFVSKYNRNTLRLKVSTVSINQLGQLGEAHKVGREGFYANTARNVTEYTAHYSHHVAKRQTNDVRAQDSILRASGQSAANVPIYEIKEMIWRVDINKLYYYSIHGEYTVVKPKGTDCDEKFDGYDSDREVTDSDSEEDEYSDVERVNEATHVTNTLSLPPSTSVADEESELNGEANVRKEE